MTNTEPLDLDVIEERADAATEGPWTRSGIHIWGPDPENPEDRFDVEPDMIGRADLKMADAEFIAHAREDVPALIAEVRRLRGLVPQGWEYGVMPAHTTEYAWPVFKTFAEAEDWRASIASEPIHEGVRVGRRVPAAVEGAWEPAPTDEETR